MKGIIFRELERMVHAELGESAWEDLLGQLGIDGFVSAETYPDDDLYRLVTALVTKTGTPQESLLFGFGRHMSVRLIADYPVFVTPNMTAKGFLSAVDNVIHVEVRKLHPDAVLPSFQCEDPGPDQLVMLYRSSRQLCDLAAGLIAGVGDHFGERVAQEHTRCLKLGDDHCRFELTFS